MTTHLDPEDEATLEVHGWQRLKHFDNETKRWLSTDVWLLQVVAGVGGGEGVRARILKNGKLFQLHAEPLHTGRPAPVPTGWVGPRFDDPAAVSRYLWMIGDGDMWNGVAKAIDDEWGVRA